MNASATRAVVLNFARFLTSARGKKISVWTNMNHWIPSELAQCVIALTKAERFSETKMMYALTKPSCEMVIEVKMAKRIHGP